jgi:hypothetical protein
MTTWLYVFDYALPCIIPWTPIEVVPGAPETHTSFNLKRLMMSHTHLVVPRRIQTLVNNFLGCYKKKKILEDISNGPVNMVKCTTNISVSN